MKQFLSALVFILLSTKANAIWESGSLEYEDGGAEISSFVNIGDKLQLQVVLCAKNQASDYRFSLLLDKTIQNTSIIEVNVDYGRAKTVAYAEIIGNSLEFHIDQKVFIALPDIPSLVLHFKKDDAELLGIPEVIDIDMKGADYNIKYIATDCTQLCTKKNDFQCDAQILSSILWPRDDLKNNDYNIDELCIKKGHYGFDFDLNDKCKLALDKTYDKKNDNSLSFLKALFFDENSSFNDYVNKWNSAVDYLDSNHTIPYLYAKDNREWYLSLYSLYGSKQIREIPQSYFDILKINEDPTTLVYDIDNRYEMETMKYQSVLMRRFNTSLKGIQLVEDALNSWNNFYRNLSQIVPQIKEAQALRPIIYRQMLLRVWRLAGMPEPLNLKKENEFIQGRYGRITSNELLEKKCAIFEGSFSDEFFYPTDDCVRGIKNSMRYLGLVNDNLEYTLSKFLDYQNTFKKSIFASGYTKESQLSLRKSLSLTLLSIFKVYGFGEYFLAKECIASKDTDICALEARRTQKAYIIELHNRLTSIAMVSPNDARNLKDLNDKYEKYYDSLKVYLDDLVLKGKLEKWQSYFVLAISNIMQTDTILNAEYDKEELPDESLYSGDDMEFFEQNSTN